MNQKIKTILAIVAGLDALVLGFVAFVYPEVTNGIYALAGLLIGLLGALAYFYQQELKEAIKTRNVRYGFNTAVTIGLVTAILVVVSFLNHNHFYKKDLTKNQVHSLSEQSIKVAKDIKQEIKVTVFAKPQQKFQIKGLLDNYGYFSKKLNIEYVDPDRDPVRAKAANIKEYGTIIFSVGKKETRVQDANEEKVTNALIKVQREKTPLMCFVTGHGEKSTEGNDAEGYSFVKKELDLQSYTAKTFNLLEEAKIPTDCDVLLVVGPVKAFFDKEIDVLAKWLDEGGRALFALDPPLKGADVKEIRGLLSKWSISVQSNLVIDPTNKLASVPLIGSFSREHAATKDFQVSPFDIPGLFPLTSTVEFATDIPTSLKTWWLVKSKPQAFTKTDFKEIASGQVRIDPTKEKANSYPLMVAIEGTRAPDKKPAKPTRIVAIGTSHLATNAYARFGHNLDLFLNAVTWLADDEALISIRPKEEDSQVPTLTKAEASFVQLLTLILMPGGVLAVGAGVWFRRRKL